MSVCFDVGHKNVEKSINRNTTLIRFKANVENCELHIIPVSQILTRNKDGSVSSASAQAKKRAAPGGILRNTSSYVQG